MAQFAGVDVVMARADHEFGQDREDEYIFWWRDN
jgi:hypothetical protein